MNLDGLREFWRKVGPHREEYRLSLMPKDRAGFLRWVMDGARDIWSFPPAPCPWLCKRNFRRFHFTCLTCWTRRLHFKKRGHEKLKWYTKAYMANKPPVGYRGAIPLRVGNVMCGDKVGLPVYYTNYGIFIPTSREGAVNRFRLVIVKYLLTLAERIAEI